jgi:serine protease Do
VPVKVIRDKEAVTLQITVEELSLEEESRQTAQNNEEQDQTSAGFGISLRNITPQISRQLGLSNDVTGAVIVNVVAGSPAARAGISQGDVVLEVNRSPARNSTEVSQALNSVPSGGVVFMLILRNGQEIFVTVTKQ